MSSTAKLVSDLPLCTRCQCSQVCQGSTISLVGIIFQLLALVVYAVLGTEFLIRYLKRNPFENHTKDQYYRGEFTRRVKLLVGCMIFMTTLIFIR